MTNSLKNYFWVLIVTAILCSIAIGGIYESRGIPYSSGGEGSGRHGILFVTNKFTGSVFACNSKACVEPVKK